MVTRMGSRVNNQALSFSDTRVTGGLREGSGVLHAENENPMVKTWRALSVTIYCLVFIHWFFWIETSIEISSRYCFCVKKGRCPSYAKINTVINVLLHILPIKTEDSPWPGRFLSWNRGLFPYSTGLCSEQKRKIRTHFIRFQLEELKRQIRE